MSRLHIFDMDGTLLRGAASVELSRYLGCFEEADAVEQAWLRGEIGARPVLGAGPADVGGHQRRGHRRAFEEAPWIDGVRDVFADIAGRGEHSVVISQSPQFFVRQAGALGRERGLRRGGRPGAAGTRSRAHRGGQGDHRRRVDGPPRAGAADCVAYGDSTSDMLLFRRLPHTVAVNAKPAIRALAAADYRGDDLREAYRAGRALLDGVS